MRTDEAVEDITRDLTPDEVAGIIDRREAIRRVSVLMGGLALAGGDRMWNLRTLARPEPGTAVGAFQATDVAFMDEVAETILPATKTPGAKAAKVGAFMALMVTDTYTAAEQATFRAGMARIEEACKAAHGHGFMQASAAERLAVLTPMDQEQFTAMKAPRKPDDPKPAFRLIKELVLLGYFTSEIGYKQAMRYIETPGRFDPCVPYKKGDKAWAAHA